jgi:hypothetical protein
MLAVWWQKRLVIFYDDGVKPGGLLIDAGQPATFMSAATLNVVTLSAYATAAYVDPLRDALYLVNATSNSVQKFDAGAPLTLLYRTGILRDTDPSMLGAIAAECHASTDYPVTVRTYCDTLLIDEASISDDQPVRMPLSGLGLEYEFEFETAGEQAIFFAADSMDGLKQL